MDKKPSFHPRNRHAGRYDFNVLIEKCPELGAFVRVNPYNDLSLDFSNPKAVKTLNRALLMHFYGLRFWDIPDGFLCPPVPGRSDYIHGLADLLSDGIHARVPRGDQVSALDVGVGASCIYPIIGVCEYGWHFRGSDISAHALTAASQIVNANDKLIKFIDLQLQPSELNILKGVIHTGEEFDLTLCNPPFHESQQQAHEGTSRKWKNLGRSTQVLNFGGLDSELWCPGGEGGFIRRMIAESVEFRKQVMWFTSLVSKEATLSSINGALKKIKVSDIRIIEMFQGQKKSRFVAWTFLPPLELQQWKTRRWKKANS